MSTREKFAITAAIIVVLAAVLMQTQSLRIAGASANFVLVALIVLGFFTDNFAFYAVCVLLATLLVRFSPLVIDPLAVVTAALALVAFWIERRLMWQGMIGIIITVITATLGAYILLEPQFIWQEPGLLAAELVYNVVVGVLLFEVLQWLFGRRIR